MLVGRLHVVTDTRPGRRPLEVVRAALTAGAPVVQVRAKTATDRELYDLTVRVTRLCDTAGALCLVDDRPDVAVAAGAAGVHLGADDLPLHAARRVLGPVPTIGATARDPATARALVAEGASYLGVGPAYPSATKAGLPDPLGPAGVGAVAGAVHVPVVAIGGIVSGRVPELIAAGAYGVAVVSEISDAADPAAATRRLLRALDRAAA